MNARRYEHTHTDERDAEHCGRGAQCVHCCARDVRVSARVYAQRGRVERSPPGHRSRSGRRVRHQYAAGSGGREREHVGRGQKRVRAPAGGARVAFVPVLVRERVVGRRARVGAAVEQRARRERQRRPLADGDWRAEAGVRVVESRRLRHDCRATHITVIMSMTDRALVFIMLFLCERLH